MSEPQTASLNDYLALAGCPANHQRAGQWAFNLLAEVRPDLATRIRSTPLDPFYDDKRMAAFLRFVQREWNAEPSDSRPGWSDKVEPDALRWPPVRD